VVYARDILPAFLRTWEGVALTGALAQALRDENQALYHSIQRELGPLRILTEENGLLPDWLKRILRAFLTKLSSLNPRKELSRFHQHAAPSVEKTHGLKKMDRNLDKPFHQHSGWKDLQHELFEILTRKGISKRRARQLIEKLFATLIPGWQEAYRHPHDAIRHAVARRQPRTRRT
jgi:hypothetical protein